MEETSTGKAIVPLARKSDLVVERMGEETLVYDLRNHKAHCLNAGAALVWHHCDGEYDRAALDTLLHEKLGIPGEAALTELTLADVALRELAAANLLESGADAPKMSRREVGRAMKRVLGASIALPAVMSIVAPDAASAASLVQDCAGFKNNGQCVSVRCSASNSAARCVWIGSGVGNGGTCVCV